MNSWYQRFTVNAKEREMDSSSAVVLCQYPLGRYKSEPGLKVVRSYFSGKRGLFAAYAAETALDIISSSTGGSGISATGAYSQVLRPVNWKTITSCES